MIAHKKILIVDDEPAYRNLINKKLKIAGYQTILAQNAEEALVALWENDSIGLVLLDIRLPMINGLNIFEIIRKDFPDKKIIVCSMLQQNEQRFLMDEAEDYYHKSEDLSRLIEKVDAVLNNGQRELRGNEKRSFKRMPVNVLAGCERHSQYTFPTYASFISYTKDLSESGGRFIVNQDVKAGQHFSVALELPINHFPLLIDCEVVWARKVEESDWKTKGSMEAGVRFVKLDSIHDEEKLKNYLNCV